MATTMQTRGAYSSARLSTECTPSAVGARSPAVQFALRHAHQQRTGVRAVVGQRKIRGAASRSTSRRHKSGLVVQAVDGYVPSPMDTSVLTAQLEVLGAVGVMVIYWWYVLVPNARVNLAVNKKKGNLAQYLRELKQDDSRPIERWFYTNWLEKVDPETRFLLRDDKPEVPKEEYKVGVEETVQEIVQNAKRTPKFWSFDNPVLVGTAITIGAAAMGSGVQKLFGGDGMM